MANPVVNWPVVTGCFRMTEGCFSCPSYWEYLEKGKDYTPVSNSEILNDPIDNSEPTTYNVAFGSDLFIDDVSFEFIQEVFSIMNLARQHTFLVATKRSKRVKELSDDLYWSDNIHLSMSVETAAYKHRIDDMRNIPAAVKVLSIVPILGPMGDLNLKGIDFVAVVPEGWGYKRPADVKWVSDVKKQCDEQGVMCLDECLVDVGV